MCLICVMSMVLRNGIRTFVMALGNLWGALLILDTAALIHMSGVYVLSKPYSVGVF